MVLTMGTECTVNYHRPYVEAADDRQMFGTFLYDSNASPANEVNVQGPAPYPHPLKMPHPSLNLAVIEAQPAQSQGPPGTSDQTECTTPEIIQNLMNLSNFDQTSQQTSGYYQEQQTDLATTPLGPNPGSVPGSSHNYGQPVTSSPPTASCAVSPTISSVQVTKHQLVMEDLKHRLKQRRRDIVHDSSPLDLMQSNSDEVGSIEEFFPCDSCDESSCFNFGSTLTPEDEERRKRRRERNKIAATKCRNKKKERTMNLIWESQHLEQQNTSLKGEVQKLESELRQLKTYLSGHHCNIQRRPYYEQQGRSSCMAL